MGELALQNENQIADFDYKAKATEWLQNMGTKLPPEQTKQFLELCQAFKLNPFKREIYAVGYGNKFSIITGYEVYLKRAERTHKLDGWQCVLNNDNTKAKVTIWRKDWSHPFEHEVFMNEVRQNSPIWTKMPTFMMRKVCIEQGMRLCFPDELGGMPYGEEEVSYDRIIQSDEDLKPVNENCEEQVCAEERILEKNEPPVSEIESELVDEKQQLQEIVEKYETALNVQNPSGNPYEMARKTLSENNPAEISKMLVRIKSYLGHKGMKVA